MGGLRVVYCGRSQSALSQSHQSFLVANRAIPGSHVWTIDKITETTEQVGCDARSRCGSQLFIRRTYQSRNGRSHSPHYALKIWCFVIKIKLLYKKNVIKIIHPQLVVFVNSSALSCTPLSGIYEDNGGHRCGLGAGCPAGRTIKCTWFSPPLKTLTPGRLVREEGLPLQKIRVQVEENVRSYQKRWNKVS